MIKYLSGRVKRTPQDRLSEDRYDYLDVKQAEPNLADPATSPPVPSGSQFQLVAVPGYPGRRYWVPIGGGLIPGAISVFDEGTIVGTANSITQLNFVGAAVTARVSVQSPSGHPGVAATVTVIPATIQDNPPLNPNPGELWWESDTGDLFIYYQDVDTAQWVTTNTGGRGDPGEKGQKGQKGELGPQGLTGGVGDEGDKGEKGQKGEEGEKGQKGQKGEVEEKGNKGEKGDKGQKGDKGEKGQKGEKGEKGQKGEKGEKGEKGQKGADGIVGSQGDKAGLRYDYSHNTSMNDPGTGIFKYNNSSTLGSVSAIAIDSKTKEGNQGIDVSDFIATWDDSTNDTIKGHLIVKSNNNADATYSIFEVTSVTDNTGWLQIAVQNPVGSFPSNNEECVINFSRTGDIGQQGTFGGVSFDYTYDATSTADTDPNAGNLKFNNTNLSSAGFLYIDDADNSGTNIENYLRTIDDSTSSVKGHIRISDKSDSTDFTIFRINGSAVEANGYHKIPVVYLDGDTSYSDNQRLIVTFARTGDKGEKGQKGEVGSKGQKGEIGSKGQKGEIGSKGQKGEGDKGQKGEDNSSKGQKGEPGDKGQKGDGDKGQKGEGDKGQKGESDKGQKGEPGDKGQKGSEAGNANTVTVRTESDNAYHNIIFVDSSADNQDQTLKMDNNSNIFAWNPSLNQLIANKCATSLMSTWGGSYGSAGQVLTSGGSSSSWTWTNQSDLTYSVPQGGIIIWSGNSGNIPSGWVLCDGSNSTPDLRDKFVVGASAGTGADTYPGLSPGATGGDADGHTIAHNHTLNHNHTYGTSTSAAGGHSHTQDAHRPSYDSEDPGMDGWAMSTSGQEGSNVQVGNSIGNHAHNFNGTTSAFNGSTSSGSGAGWAVSRTNKNLPPYYALCYIMKT